MDIGVQPSTRSQRILAAIMLTDAVGFSARMSVDEETTLHLIQRDLDLFGSLCNEFEGQVLKSTGDGLLMYFVSAVQAVACGLEMQRRLREFSHVAAEGLYLDHRIGIHLGDVLFNQVDVLGNGVNIAARLQNHADPGGLCISQTIYDVVKARLNLNTTYLGPVQLKNIQEPVPSYKVHLSESEDKTLSSRAELASASASLGSTAPLATVNPCMAVVQTLSHHPEQQRIKKLIFGTCHETWENDSEVLARFELADLVDTLLQRYSTLEQCEAELNRVVASLNRKSQYAAIAPVIVQNLAILYAELEVEPDELVSQDSDDGNSIEYLYQQVATQLEGASNCHRIKKLMYCICYSAWENNPDALAQLDSQDLVQRLHQLAPTPRDLKYRLSQAIKRLNRQGVYTRVANTILYYCRTLYVNGHEAHRLAAPIPKAGELLASMTRIGTVASPQMHETTQVYSAPLRHVSTQEEGGGSLRATSTPVKDRTNLFDLRLEIMRYTNPLRAKLLLYSCLHGPFGFAPPDWSYLRSQTIDDLVRGVFDYCETFDDLESKLEIIAHCLGENDENTQVAGALSQAMKPYYPAVSVVAS
ncbi:MAG: adenylate/guanylate cyclase domain-containing protein [Cyanobacteria bacterium P01_A01_bin.123]